MNVSVKDVPTGDATGAPYVTGNFAPLMNEVTGFDFTGEPIAMIRLPVRVPFAFHGGWAADQEAPPPVG